MHLFTKLIMTAVGLVLVLTAAVGDAPGALLGVALISYAWLGK